MSGCSQPPIAVQPLCFSLALPSVPSSSPNPFQLVVLSNFTQSRSLSWKRGIWPPSPANYSLFLSPSSSSDHRSTALWPALAQNYEGYFQHCNLKNTWYTHRRTLTYKMTYSANTQTLGIDQKIQLDRREEGRHKCPLRHVSLNPQKHLSPSGSGQQMCLFSLGAGSDELCSPVQESRAEAWLYRDVKETHLKTRGQYREVMAERAEPRIAKSVRNSSNATYVYLWCSPYSGLLIKVWGF